MNHLGAAVIRRDARSQPPKSCIFKASLLKHKPIYQTRNIPHSYSAISRLLSSHPPPFFPKISCRAHHAPNIYPSKNQYPETRFAVLRIVLSRANSNCQRGEFSEPARFRVTGTPGASALACRKKFVDRFRKKPSLDRGHIDPRYVVTSKQKARKTVGQGFSQSVGDIYEALSIRTTRADHPVHA